MIQTQSWVHNCLCGCPGLDFPVCERPRKVIIGGSGKLDWQAPQAKGDSEIVELRKEARDKLEEELFRVPQIWMKQ
eukprot:4489322-Heterocapsa_arctica.AAC.1